MAAVQCVSNAAAQHGEVLILLSSEASCFGTATPSRQAQPFLPQKSIDIANYLEYFFDLLNNLLKS